MRKVSSSTGGGSDAWLRLGKIGAIEGVQPAVNRASPYKPPTAKEYKAWSAATDPRTVPLTFYDGVLDGVKLFRLGR